MLLWFGVALAADDGDPGCRGRVRDKDTEVVFEFLAEAGDGLRRSVEIRPGTGPEVGRGSVQGRLRSQLHSFLGCYEARFGAEPGLDIRMTVSFDVERGRPAQVTVDGPSTEAALLACVRSAVLATPLVCKLDATGFIYPLRFRTEGS